MKPLKKQKNKNFLSEIVQKIKRIYFEKGFYSLLFHIIKKTIQIFGDTNSAIWYIKELNDKFYKINPKINVEVNLNSFENTVMWLKECTDKWVYNENEVEIAKKENHYFPSVIYKGRIIGCLKVGFNNVYIQDYQKVIKFPKNTAFIYDTYVLPEFRGLSIAPFLINEVCKLLKHKGYKKIMCHIPSRNTSSKRAYLKVGFKPVKCIRWIRILNFHFFSTNPTTL